jgi:hypothetical protein
MYVLSTVGSRKYHVKFANLDFLDFFPECEEVATLYIYIALSSLYEN